MIVNEILVGGLEHFFDFTYIGNVIIPTDFHSIIFQRDRSTTKTGGIPCGFSMFFPLIAWWIVPEFFVNVYQAG